jgi:hypothetical protein
VEISDLNSINPILDRHHELCHYQSLVSSPFGMFLFRLLGAISSCVQYVSLKIASEYGAVYKPNLPINNWYLESGKYLIDESKKFSPDLPLRKFLEAKLFEAQLYRTLETQILYPKDCLVGNLCDILNRSLRLLQALHQLPKVPKVISNYDYDSLAVENAELSTVSLLEAISMSGELQLLIGFKVSSDILHQWESTRLQGIYRTVFEYVSEQLSHSMKRANLAFDISLFGQIDPVFCDEDEILLEDIHPVMRLKRVIPLISDLPDFALKPEKIKKSVIAIFDELKWPTYKKLLSTARDSSIICPSAYAATMEAFDTNNSDTIMEEGFYNDVFSECIDGIEFRVDNPGIFAFHATPLVYQPLLEFYNDCSYIHRTPKRANVHYVLMRYLVLGLTCAGLLDADPESFSLANQIFSSFASTGKLSERWDNSQFYSWLPTSYYEMVQNDLGLFIEHQN